MKTKTKQMDKDCKYSKSCGHEFCTSIDCEDFQKKVSKKALKEAANAKFKIEFINQKNKLEIIELLSKESTEIRYIEHSRVDERTNNNFILQIRYRTES